MSQNGSMRRPLRLWTIWFLALIAAFICTIAILNTTIYSAHGFVSSYLDALNSHDATTARQLPGVRAPSGEATTLLTDGALGTIADIHLDHDTTGKKGVHSVAYSYRLGGRAETTNFSVEQTKPFLGLFSRWAFHESPLATVAVSPLHDRSFRVNGTPVTSTAMNGNPASYVVFTPGLYTFDHRSTFLVATPVGVPVSEPGSVTPVQVDVQANAQFIADVRGDLDKYFTKCATQRVLLPTSCPFGKSFVNRVVSTPVWAIKTDPPITIVPDHGTDNWLVPYATGIAHLTVKVQSLYNGSVSTFDGDVPFPVSYSITIGANDHLTITSLYN